MNTNLLDIYNYLLTKEKYHTLNKASFPKLWLHTNNNFETGTISENPYEFYINNIKHVIDSNENHNLVTSKNIKIYGAHLRSLTSFSHENENLTKNGTILKTILLLPYLKKIGINALYLLPINKPSYHVLKGDLPSPYATKSFYDLDPILDDKLLNGEFSLSQQFRALVEACHKLGIKVILDFVFRSVGRDHDWVMEEPNWFTWIEKSNEPSFKAPQVKYLNPFKSDELIIKQIAPSDVQIIFKNESTKAYLDQFKTLSPELIQEIKSSHIKDLKTIETRFNLTTTPAFSDWFNDSQPPWTDITFLRYFLDHPNDSKNFLKENQAPYQHYDVIHCDRIVGEIKNEKLWDRVSNIIPKFITDFGIDGARIDMAHSMPKELMDIIIKKAKQINSNFLFISEDFDMTPGEVQHKTKQYDIFLGNLWHYQTPQAAKYLRDVLYSQVGFLPMTVIASSETADTSRTAGRVENYLEYAKAVFLLNSFLPNSALFINSGFELLEKQALNGALATPDNTIESPKIAFFNHFEMNWNNTEATEFINFIIKVNNSINTAKSKPNFVEEASRKLIVIKQSPYYIIANFSESPMETNFQEYFAHNIVLSSHSAIEPGKLAPLQVILTQEK